MKLVHISDTHMQHERLVLPEGDVLIHSGDALNYGKKEELFQFSQWWKKQEFKFKIFIPGNHDWVFQKDEQWSREMMLGTEVLINQVVVIDGVKFYGTPWQPVFCDWAFNLPDYLRRVKFEAIPECDVLISHAPPRGVCDQLPRGEHIGDSELARVLDRVKVAVLCGHIHNGYGVFHGEDGLSVYNSAICNEQYKPVNKPHVIDLKEVGGE